MKKLSIVVLLLLFVGFVGVGSVSLMALQADKQFFTLSRLSENLIFRTNLQTGNRTVFVSVPQGEILDFAVDETNLYFYISECFREFGKITKFKLLRDDSGTLDLDKTASSQNIRQSGACISDIELDIPNQKIYFIDGDTGVFRADTNGQNLERVVAPETRRNAGSFPSPAQRSLQLDLINGHLYYAVHPLFVNNPPRHADGDFGMKTEIRRASLNGLNNTAFYEFTNTFNGSKGINQILVDSKNRKLVMSVDTRELQPGSLRPKFEIRRLNLNGTNEETIVRRTEVDNITTLFIDFNDNFLYWSETPIVRTDPSSFHTGSAVHYRSTLSGRSIARVLNNMGFNILHMELAN